MDGVVKNPGTDGPALNYLLERGSSKSKSGSMPFDYDYGYDNDYENNFKKGDQGKHGWRMAPQGPDEDLLKTDRTDSDCVYGLRK